MSGSEPKVMLENEPRCRDGSTMPMSVNDGFTVRADDDWDWLAGRTILESRTTTPTLAMRVADVEKRQEFFQRLI